MLLCAFDAFGLDSCRLLEYDGKTILLRTQLVHVSNLLEPVSELRSFCCLKHVLRVKRQLQPLP